MAVDNVGMHGLQKFGDSGSNGFRDVRGADFVSNQRTLAKPIPIARNAKRRSPKNTTRKTFFLSCLEAEIYEVLKFLAFAILDPSFSVHFVIYWR